MKRFLFVVSLIAFGNMHAQNQWDGSAISTITTNGKVAIGVATPVSGYSLSVSNTLNTQANAVNIDLTNTMTGQQIGFNNRAAFNGLSGTKYASYFGMSSSTTGDAYSIFSVAVGSNSGARYGIASVVALNNGIKCAILGNIVDLNVTRPSTSRAGFFVGSTEIISSSNTEKAFIINRRDIGTAGIGTDVFRIYGDGKVYATEINVKAAANFPDYVFKPGYQLMPLGEVKTFIETNGHLPNIPSAATVESEGMNIGELNRVMVEKIEELTLYILQQQAEIDALKAKLNQSED